MINENTIISKFLSYVLRHAPESIGIEFDQHGWVEIDTLLAAAKKHGHEISRETLNNVVSINDKQRFKISDDGTHIRASQGHSIEVELDLQPVIPPDFLYHGTVSKFLDAIQSEGLKKMKRQHVHLSADIQTATKVGSRRGTPVILVINARKMFQDGCSFYLSDNNVWLTDAVPSKYISLGTMPQDK
jgi:putative RNA 2'-phosphotransferase